MTQQNINNSLALSTHTCNKNYLNYFFPSGLDKTLLENHSTLN